MKKVNKKEAVGKLELNKVITLSKEQNERLSMTPLKHAKGMFEALARWRNKSLTSGYRV